MKTSRALLVAALAAGVLAAPTATADASPNACKPWKVRQLDTYAGLENLAFDGHGRMLLSETALSGTGKISTRTPSGRKGVWAAHVEGPGGISLRDGEVYFTTGNGPVSGITDAKDGTISTRNGVVARGLTMPNGLAATPDGGFIVSRDLGGYTGLTQVTKNGVQRRIARGLTSTNGGWWDTKRQRVLVSTSFDTTTRVAANDPDHPNRWKTVAVIPGYGPVNTADDLTSDADGNIYVALSVGMKVVRIDAKTRAQCVVATGIPLASSVRFGAGPGWDSKSLYATSLAGGLYKITPSAR